MASIDLSPEQAHANNLRTLKHIYQGLSEEEVERVYAVRTSGSSDLQESVRFAVLDLYVELHPGKVRAPSAAAARQAASEHATDAALRASRRTRRARPTGRRSSSSSGTASRSCPWRSARRCAASPVFSQPKAAAGRAQ
jgi:hypothetical protein